VDELNSLDAAFELPDVITDPKLRGLYEVLIHRMRAEARALPMSTVQELLIERIAFNYIVLRSKERGELGGFGSATVQKDYNTFWLSMTSEFNRTLGKVEPLTNADRKALLKDIQQIIISTVQQTGMDPRTRSELLENMATAFETAKI
jgi:hypothetical protein